MSVLVLRRSLSIRAAFHSPSRRAPDSALSSAAEQSDSTHRCEAKGCLARARSERRAASHRLRGGAAVWTIMQGCLEEDLAALRKLRDDEASGVLKEYFGDGEDPRGWKDGDGDKIVTVEDGRVTALEPVWTSMCDSSTRVEVSVHPGSACVTA